MHNLTDLPSYHHPNYDHLAPALKLLRDVYDDLYGCKAEYLPKAQLEQDIPYARRVEAAVFNNKTKPLIESNAGLLTAFEVEGMPPTLAATQENVDGKGTDLMSFVYEANIAALRDGTTYVLTLMEDAPPGQERTLADDLANPRRPYWKLVDRRSILNWREGNRNGEAIIEQVTICLHEDVPDGTYGLKSEPRYNVLRLVDNGVIHEVWALGKKNELIATKQPRLIAIPRIPLTAYPDAASSFPTDLPDFYKAASLNVKLFRQESALDSIQYFANCPTPWRRSRLPIKPSEYDEARPPFVLGERYVIELMAADDTHGPDEVGVLEVSGSSIAALQKGVADTKADIEAEALGFVSGSRVARTATEAYLSGAQVSASLNGKARQMGSALGRMVADWCLFTGEDPSAFRVIMDHSVLEQPLDAQELGQLLQMWREGAIDHQTLLELMKMGHQLPPSANINEIIERVKDEERSRIAPRDDIDDLPLGVRAPLPQPQPQNPVPPVRAASLSADGD